MKHVVTENAGPSLGFTLVTNPMYDLPLNYAPEQVPTQSQSVHIPLSNEIPIMQKNLTIRIDEEGPHFIRNVLDS